MDDGQELELDPLAISGMSVEKVSPPSVSR